MLQYKNHDLMIEIELQFGKQREKPEYCQIHT